MARVRQPSLAASYPLLPDPLSYIEGDRFWPFLTKTEKRSRSENFGVPMRSMTAAAVPFARSGFDVLLDFSIPPEFLTTARKILKEIPLDYIVLVAERRCMCCPRSRPHRGRHHRLRALS